MSRTNKTQFAILGYLTKRDAMSGYDIKRLLEKVASFYWSESNSQLYPLLKKLLAQDMVTMAETQESGRKRNLYSITEKGREHLLTWLRQDVEETTIRNELMLKLSLAQHLSTTDTLEHIDYFAEQVQSRKRKLKKIQQHIENDHKNRQDQEYLLMTYRHSELILEAQEKWCKEVQKN
ncbi:hypothetical protein BGC07_09930 [Piscirickettsia litoralis]|uniref:PadR family transcriptional regulator n=2 Tax=Piscirickettsia litoralis TaxID=1891921 RepID=A0ABX3A654_9GAMM|nr:hypothetical protein BGC07_09930 [Piscirickettsia litoralis]